MKNGAQHAADAFRYLATGITYLQTPQDADVSDVMTDDDVDSLDSDY